MVSKYLGTLTATTGVLLLAGLAARRSQWQWVPASYEKLEQAERKLLQSTVAAPFEMTKVARLGTVIVPCTDAEKRRSGEVKDLVLIHGFASGNAFWATTYDELAKHFNVYAVEWIGAGRSDRPDFPFNDFDSANAYVLDAFEQWRKEMKLEEFNLCAHSMGAIFASTYALQNPQKVKHLVLASPAGVGHPPPPPPEGSDEAIRRNSWLRRLVFFLWDNAVTPMTVARVAGPYGPQLVNKILLKRISFMPESSALRKGSVDVNDLAEYIYHNWALKASSERTMTTHLAPMALSRRPLVDMLTPERVEMPVTFIYGGHSDWMDYRQGLVVVKQLVEAGKRSSLHLIPHAGHQVFFDNPRDFNRAIVQSLLREE